MAASQIADREPTKVAIVGESDHIVAEMAARIFADFAGYSLIAIGLTLIWGVMNFVIFAHGVFLLLGM